MHRLAAVMAIPAFALASAASADLPNYQVQVIGAGLRGLDMNLYGDVVGRRDAEGGISEAFVARLGAELEVLPVPSGWVGAVAYGINAGGSIVGAVSTLEDPDASPRACAWYPQWSGYLCLLLGQPPGQTTSAALAVNDLEDIVGGSGGSGMEFTTGVLWWNGLTLELPGVTRLVDVSIQRRGIEGNVVVDLDSLASETVPLPPGGWSGMSSRAINDAGDFCGHLVPTSGCGSVPAVRWAEAGWELLDECAAGASIVSMNNHGDLLMVGASGQILVRFAGESTTRSLESLIPGSQGEWIVTSAVTINDRRQILCEAVNPPREEILLVRLTPIVPGDLDGDGLVNGADLGTLLGQWGSCVGCSGDFNADGVVDGNDLGTLLGGWTG